MATYTTVIPGLPGGPLVTNHPVKIKLIPEWRTLNRPGIKARTPRRSVQHGNDNPNSSAAGEANYLYGGAGGRQASYHSSTDDRETWIMVPADEVTWQAADGSGPGNMNGFSNELVEDARLWADPARRDRAIDNVATFMGAVAARLGIARPERHWDFNYMQPPSQRHDCPNKLKYTWIGGRLAWDIYVETWYRARADELARMGGAVPPTPDIIDVGDTLRTLVRLNLRERPGTAAPVLATLDVGTEAVVTGTWTEADGYGWLPVTTPAGAGAVAQGDASGPYVEVIARADPAPAPDPAYAAPDPIPALADLPAFVALDNGARLYRVDDLTVRAVRATPRRKWASRDSPRIGPDVPAGATFSVAYLIVNPDGSLYWYTPWSTRFAYADVEPVIVTDAA